MADPLGLESSEFKPPEVCVCSGLHVDCEPETCGKAYRADGSSDSDGPLKPRKHWTLKTDWTMSTTMNLVKEAADGGCETCQVLFRGLVEMANTRSEVLWGIECCVVRNPEPTEEDLANTAEKLMELDGDDDDHDKAARVSTNDIKGESYKTMPRDSSLINDKRSRKSIKYEDAWNHLTLKNFEIHIDRQEGYIVLKARHSPEFYYDFYTFSSSHSQQCHSFSRPKLLSHFNSECADSFVQLRQWMQDCSLHDDCKDDVVVLPKRLIDVGENVKPQLSQDVRLIESFGAQGRYLTLTHVWGLVQVARTTRQNYPQRTTNITLDELSKTFRDAVTITRALGFRYIWIDSLCIVQDDPDDWRCESVKMQAIYRNSYATISATHAKDGSGGCFNNSIKAEAALLTQEVEIHSKNTSVCFAPQLSHAYFAHPHADQVEPPPVSTRGWILQERALARRVIHYTAHELAWECHQAVECLCGRVKTQERGNWKAAIWSAWNQASTASELHDLWDNLVDGFTERNLSHDSDRLVAFSGIIAEFEAAGSGDIIMGVWKEQPIETMSWFVSPSQAITTRRLQTQIAPSWSWASLIGQVKFPHLAFSTVRDHRIFPVHSEFLANNISTGPRITDSAEMQSHVITISGQVIQRKVSIDVEVTGASSKYLLFSHDDLSSCRFLPDVPSEIEQLPKDCLVTCVLWSIMPDGDLGALPLWGDIGVQHLYGEASYLMVLHPSTHHPDCYERLGVARLVWSRRNSDNWPRPHDHLLSATGIKVEDVKAATAEEWFRDALIQMIKII